MTATIPAMVNPPLLLWARTESGYDLEEAARRLAVKPDRLLSWEAGERRPTIRQARELARVYRRPLGVFFLPRPPVIPPLAAEYRRLSGVPRGGESPELRFALREMSVRREAAIELREELGYPVENPALALHLSEGVVRAAERVRAALGVAIEDQLAWKDGWRAWRGWRSAAEEAGILVFQFAGVPLEQVRGVSLLRFPLPAVGISTKETAPEARAFTLLHEVVHIGLTAGREEAPAALEHSDKAHWKQVEKFAEEVAGAALMPESALRNELARIGGQPAQWEIDAVRALARRFGVTPLAMATRLLALREMTPKEYAAWRALWEDIVSKRPAKGGGFATPVDKTLGRGGRPFARLVLEALDSNRITAAQASHYLDLKFGHMATLRTELGFGAGGME